MADFTIFRGSTRAWLKIKPSDPFGPYVRTFTKHLLTEREFNKRFRCYIETRRYSHYDPYESRLYIPVGFVERLVDHIEQAGMSADVFPENPEEGRDITLTMNPKWQDRPWQTGAIEYLINGGEPRRGLQFQPGKGKTYCAIKAIVGIGKAAIVIVPGLVEQWEASFKEQTDIGNDLYIIRGFQSVNALVQCDWKPKVMLCSIDTIRMFVNQQGNFASLGMSFEQFLQRYEIGVKVMDEVHLNFHALTQIDLRTNVQHNIYLTATFTSGNPDTRRIFDVVYPSIMRYGAEDYKRYVNVTFYRYYGEVLEKKVVRSKGYSHARYEYEIFKKPNRFKNYMEKVIVPVVNSHYINLKNPGEKCLLFFSTIEMVNLVADYLQKEYPQLVISKYIGGSSEEALGEGVDIIITTPKSAGVGTDIACLRTAINTISEKAPTAVEQKRGRLRELKNGATPEYVDLFDGNLECHIRHWKERSWIHRSRAKAYSEYEI